MKKTKQHKNARMYKGLPLIDATSDMEICVTKSDVSKSRKNDPLNCAAANAIKRIMHTDAEVHISRTYVKDGDKRYIRFLTPSSISREITSFDRSSIFEPGTYNLKAPNASARLDYYKHRSPEKETRTSKKRKLPYHITANIRESAR